MRARVNHRVRRALPRGAARDSGTAFRTTVYGRVPGVIFTGADAVFAGLRAAACGTFPARGSSPRTIASHGRDCPPAVSFHNRLARPGKVALALQSDRPSSAFSSGSRSVSPPIAQRRHARHAQSNRAGQARLRMTRGVLLVLAGGHVSCRSAPAVRRSQCCDEPARMGPIGRPPASTAALCIPA